MNSLLYQLRKISQILAVFSVLAILFPSLSYALSVTQTINSLQTATPGLPSVDNPKGNIGYILANIFYGSADGAKNGLIKPEYLDGVGVWKLSGANAFFTSTGNIGVGTSSPGVKFDVSGGSVRTSGQFISTAPTGSPIVVTSTTVNTNLNADLLDGLHLNSTTTNNEANKVVRTDGAGYTNFGWINTTSGDNGVTVPTRIYASQDGYIRYYTPTNFRQVLDVPTRTGGNASGTWGIGITGNAATATSSPLLSSLGAYVWSAATTPSGYNTGIQTSFVSSAQGFQNYGSLMTMKAYSGGGGALQLYTPYSPTYGGTGLQVRYGNYDVSAGDSWTSWKTLLASDNFNTYSPTLTGGNASGTWGIGITGNAATATALQTSRTINGVAFNGTANIVLPTVNTTGNQSINGQKFFLGNVGIGTTTPSQPLTVLGKSQFSRDGVAECCGNDATITLGESTSATGKRASISFHNAGLHEGGLELTGTGTRRFRMYDNQGATMGLEVTGNVTALAPTAADHLATKAYVDAAVSAGGGGGGLKVYRYDGALVGNFLGYESQYYDAPIPLCRRMIYSDTAGNIQPVGDACAQPGSDVTNDSRYYFPNTTCSGTDVYSYPASSLSSITIKNGPNSYLIAQVAYTSGYVNNPSLIYSRWDTGTNSCITQTLSVAGSFRIFYAMTPSVCGGGPCKIK